MDPHLRAETAGGGGVKTAAVLRQQWYVGGSVCGIGYWSALPPAG